MNNRINDGITCFLGFVIFGFVGLIFSNLVFYLFEKKFVWESFARNFIETGRSNIFVYLLIMVIFPGLMSLAGLVATIGLLDKKNEKPPVQNNFKNILVGRKKMDWRWNSSARPIFRFIAGILGILAIIIGSIVAIFQLESWYSTIPVFFWGIVFVIVAFKGRIVTRGDGQTRSYFKILAFLMFGLIFILGIVLLVQKLLH